MHRGGCADKRWLEKGPMREMAKKDLLMSSTTIEFIRTDQPA